MGQKNVVDGFGMNLAVTSGASGYRQNQRFLERRRENSVGVYPEIFLNTREK